MFAFNAGVWGYDDWAPTVALVAAGARATRAPLVVTSYCAREAADDEEAIDEAIAGALGGGAMRRSARGWRPELNPFRSLTPRASSVAAHAMAENSCWQCVCLEEDGGEGS